MSYDEDDQDDDEERQEGKQEEDSREISFGSVSDEPRQPKRRRTNADDTTSGDESRPQDERKRPAVGPTRVTAAPQAASLNFDSSAPAIQQPANLNPGAASLLLQQQLLGNMLGGTPASGLTSGGAAIGNTAMNPAALLLATQMQQIGAQLAQQQQLQQQAGGNTVNIDQQQQQQQVAAASQQQLWTMGLAAAAAAAASNPLTAVQGILPGVAAAPQPQPQQPSTSGATLSPQILALLAQFAAQQPQPQGVVAPGAGAAGILNPAAWIPANASAAAAAVAPSRAGSTFNVVTGSSSGGSNHNNNHNNNHNSLSNHNSSSTDQSQHASMAGDLRALMGNPSAPFASQEPSATAALSVARFPEQQQQQHPQDAQLTGRPTVIMYISCDDDSLSEYQCLARKQMELFEAGREDVHSNAQGRNRPIVMGQVGIRCRHCTMLPPKHRARGAIYYPQKLEGVYQAAQNMASSHLCEHCQHVPDPIRKELLKLRDRKSSAGGGKKYWADGVRVLGVYEDEAGLRFERR